MAKAPPQTLTLGAPLARLSACEPVAPAAPQRDASVSQCLDGAATPGPFSDQRSSARWALAGFGLRVQSWPCPAPDVHAVGWPWTVPEGRGLGQQPGASHSSSRCCPHSGSSEAPGPPWLLLDMGSVTGPAGREWAFETAQCPRLQASWAGLPSEWRWPSHGGVPWGRTGRPPLLASPHRAFCLSWPRPLHPPTSPTVVLPHLSG